MATAPRITILPPGPERPDLHWPQRVYRAGPKSNMRELTAMGLPFDAVSGEKRSLPIKARKIAGAHRHECPAWALDENRASELVVQFLERRVLLKDPQRGTLAERLERVDSLLKDRARRIESKMIEMSHEFIATEDHERRERLASEIANYDVQLRFADGHSAFKLLAGVVFRYFRLGDDSVAVGQALKIEPRHVRQLIYRLRCLHEGRPRYPKNSHRSSS